MFSRDKRKQGISFKNQTYPVTMGIIHIMLAYREHATRGLALSKYSQMVVNVIITQGALGPGPSSPAILSGLPSLPPTTHCPRDKR